jgi:hypothetical protein
MHAVGRIRSAFNTRLCLQVDGGDVFNGAGISLGVATPGEIERQEWTVHTDGSVQVSNLAGFTWTKRPRCYDAHCTVSAMSFSFSPCFVHAPPL